MFGKKKKFTFVNYGGAYQLRIESIEDLEHLDELDEIFWVATSAPIHQLRCDPVALELLDYNRNGRIICREIRRTQRWLFRVLNDRNAVNERLDTAQLEHINADDPDGAKLLTAARRVLSNLDKADSSVITLQDVRDNKAILAKGSRNGDGVIPPDSIDDEALQNFITDVMSSVGKETGIAGNEGVNGDLLDAFLAHAKTFLDWQKLYTESAAAEGHPMLPLGEDTASAHKAYAAVADKVTAYFELCKVTAVNELMERSSVPVEAPAETYTSPEARQDYLSASPIARPRADGRLVIDKHVNPFYSPALEDLRSSVLNPLLGAQHGPFSEEDWQTVQNAFAAYEEWLAKKSGGEVESLGTDKLNDYLEGDLHDKLRGLIDEDLRVGEELSGLKEVERLLLMQRWYLDVCNNFISFPKLYQQGTRAMFEIGRLVIDGRIFNFNMRVQNVDQHSKDARPSGIFLMYAEVTARPEDPVWHIVTPVTCRHRGNLGLGKRGVLFDLDGKIWDVRVVKVIENPISLTEAILAPFKKISTLITSAVEKISASTEQSLEASLTKTTTSVEKGFAQSVQAPAAPVAPAAAPAPAEVPATRTRDMMLTGGIAFAALGSSFAYITSTIVDLGIEKSLMGVAAGLLIALVPILMVAAIKLHARNLSSILEASGWAINARMRLTHRLARRLAPDPVRPESLAKLRGDLLRL
jgi:hypothetical protein